MTRWTSALLFTALVAVASPAAAQRGGNAHPIDSVRFDVHADFAWYGAFGLGFRVDIPVIPDGFLRSGGSVQDDFVISPGVDVFFWNSIRYRYYRGCGNPDGCYSSAFGGVFASFVVAAQWNLYIGNWSFFPEAGLALLVGDAAWYYDTYYHSVIWPFFGGGGRWHFSASNSLLLRATWPAGLQLGITF